ncbi:LysR family transcriptional regulator [Aliiroseovarius sp. KMU-50]|uniref:LysR family transcriptional regulator n=1 Tax=Aliiroseovarius salicola TaxID=3009082 RepID=A0ABT4W437_9RHOB|nr:LysR family transcriptional regulator [Aliiroseovarius sp. KMU-50]MDA5095292.1 LysR family transcriptional regulator [Aliiroseovarius sp. KMU-50]
MYTLEQLRMLVDVADTGSFSACARKLGKAQSAVSQGIANLEVDLDLQLFDRSTRIPTLTPDGHRILDMARAVLVQATQLDIGARSIHKGDEAHIRLVVDDALLLPQLGNTLDRFGKAYPATRLELVTSASPDVAEMIAKGQADLGIFFTPIAFDDSTDVCFIGNLPFVAVCHPSHPLAKRTEIAAHDLFQHRQLLIRGLQGQAVEMLNLVSAQAWWTNSFQGLLHMCQQGLGWTYLPDHMAAPLIAAGQLHQMQVSFDHKPWSPPVELVYRKHKVMGPALSWLKEELKTLL